jgi:hypothetical protein
MMARLTTGHARNLLGEQLPALRAMLEHQRRLRLAQVAEFDAMITDTDTHDGHARRDITLRMSIAAPELFPDLNVALALVADDSYPRLSPNAHSGDRSCRGERSEP